MVLQTGIDQPLGVRPQPPASRIIRVENCAVTSQEHYRNCPRAHNRIEKCVRGGDLRFHGRNTRLLVAFEDVTPVHGVRLRTRKAGDGVQALSGRPILTLWLGHSRTFETFLPLPKLAFQYFEWSLGHIIGVWFGGTNFRPEQAQTIAYNAPRYKPKTSPRISRIRRKRLVSLTIA